MSGDGILRGEDAERVLRQMREGTPNTPKRVEMIREADRIYAEYLAQRGEG